MLLKKTKTNHTKSIDVYIDLKSASFIAPFIFLARLRLYKILFIVAQTFEIPHFRSDKWCTFIERSNGRFEYVSVIVRWVWMNALENLMSIGTITNLLLKNRAQSIRVMRNVSIRNWKWETKNTENINKKWIAKFRMEWVVIKIEWQRKNDPKWQVHNWRKSYHFWRNKLISID